MCIEFYLVGTKYMFTDFIVYKYLKVKGYEDQKRKQLFLVWKKMDTAWLIVQINQELKLASQNILYTIFPQKFINIGIILNKMFMFMNIC